MSYFVLCKGHKREEYLYVSMFDCFVILASRVKRLHLWVEVKSLIEIVMGTYCD
jgi:hypothetical protein